MDEQSEQVVTKRPKIRKVACFTVFFVIIFSICGGISAIFWAGGWAKDITCGLVKEESYLWDKANCQVTSVSEVQQDDEVIEVELPEGSVNTEEIATTIIEEVSPGVVTISVSSLSFDYEKGYIDEQSGIGSGFVVDSEGLIITNQHVVSDLNAEYSVVLPGGDEAIPVQEIYRDKTNDIAIIKIEKSGLKALKLGDSTKLKRGNLVVAIGNPFGDLEGTSTVGYVSGLFRDVEAGSGFGGSVTHYEGVIQTDAAINPGNSGGPLLNSSGEVVGVNFATTQGADNTSFAIPINTVKDRLAVFEEKGRFPQPYVGISYSQRTFFMKDGIISGAVIIEVEEGGPANNSGIQRGDVILEVDGKSLSQYSLAEIIQGAEVGEELVMKVWREGKTRTAKVNVGDKGE